jgi:hypothetical protein
MVITFLIIGLTSKNGFAIFNTKFNIPFWSYYLVLFIFYTILDMNNRNYKKMIAWRDKRIEQLHREVHDALFLNSKSGRRIK